MGLVHITLISIFHFTFYFLWFVSIRQEIIRNLYEYVCTWNVELSIPFSLGKTIMRIFSPRFDSLWWTCERFETNTSECGWWWIFVLRILLYHFSQLSIFMDTNHEAYGIRYFSVLSILILFFLSFSLFVYWSSPIVFRQRHKCHICHICYLHMTSEATSRIWHASPPYLPAARN